MFHDNTINCSFAYDHVRRQCFSCYFILIGILYTVLPRKVNLGSDHDSTLIIVFLIYVRIKFYWIRKILAEKNENGLVWEK
jgi:hypothetical protein